MTAIMLTDEDEKAYRIEKKITRYLKSIGQDVLFSGIGEDYGINYSLQSDLGRSLYGSSFTVKTKDEGRSGVVEARYFLEGEPEDLLKMGPDIICLRGEATQQGLDAGEICFVEEGVAFDISHRFSSLEEIGGFLEKVRKLKKEAEGIPD